MLPWVAPCSPEIIDEHYYLAVCTSHLGNPLLLLPDVADTGAILYVAIFLCLGDSILGSWSQVVTDDGVRLRMCLTVVQGGQNSRGT